MDNERKEIYDSLSNTEQELFLFLSNLPGGASIKIIEEQLSPKHVGALGRLIGRKLVESTKIKQGEGYNIKYIKVYRIVEKDN